ncbi:Adenylate kinase 8 [Chelonia mydas]|uniref:Adenylate kinase 8 n=1 Tax=Chelonia mydas TaxID=8469 RepID=M7BGB3_CHEMY|nr:Adenylate kinase 8 [Chelonia mydas]
MEGLAENGAVALTRGVVRILNIQLQPLGPTAGALIATCIQGQRGSRVRRGHLHWLRGTPYPSPAVGRLATWLCKQLNTPCITQETLLEETLELTKEVTAFQERGQKIPNALWANLIQERLSNVDCIKQGWILEGFPENRDQAWMLQLAGITPRHVVVLYAPDTVLIERNLGKRIDPSTKEVYHTTFDWPSDPLVQQRLVEAEGISEQETAKHLLEYHRNFPRVFQIYQQILKSINADQPCADVFSQALTYVQTWCRSAAPFTPRILFCGPPGSGKSLQAALIAQKYSIVNICCGQLLKEAVADKTKLGELIKPYFDSGWPETVRLFDSSDLDKLILKIAKMLEIEETDKHSSG